MGVQTDQYALAQLYKVNAITQEAYQNMQFNKGLSTTRVRTHETETNMLQRTVVNSIMVYTLVDLSASYLDLVKDHVYCDPEGSLSRRSTQTVMFAILRNYLSMIAPIVPILSEEVWVHTPAILKKEVVSPTMLGWYKPEEKWNNRGLVEDFGQLELVHSAVKMNIEQAKTAK